MINLRGFRNANNLKQSDIASYLGVSIGYISQLEAGKMAISKARLSQILNNDLGWDTSCLQDVSTVSPMPSRTGSIPLITAVADYLSGNATIDECDVYTIPAFHDADYLTTVMGSAMSPTLLSGDIIACRKMPSDGIIQWGKIYLVDIGQGAPLILRIRPGSSADAVQLVSDNPSYDPIEIPRTSITALALVIGFIRVD